MTLARIGAASAALLLVASCGGGSSSGGPVSSTSPTPSSSQSSPPAAAATAQSLTNALLHRTRSPRPTAASCRAATAAEVTTGPFGTSSQPQFTCRLTISGKAARYDVQVQGNGCYVAERHRPGQAVYGCGARSRA